MLIRLNLDIYLLIVFKMMNTSMFPPTLANKGGNGRSLSSFLSGLRLIFLPASPSFSSKSSSSLSSSLNYKISETKKIVLNFRNLT